MVKCSRSKTVMTGMKKNAATILPQQFKCHLNRMSRAWLNSERAYPAGAAVKKLLVSIPAQWARVVLAVVVVGVCAFWLYHVLQHVWGSVVCDLSHSNFLFSVIRLSQTLSTATGKSEGAEPAETGDCSFTARDCSMKYKQFYKKIINQKWPTHNLIL